MAGDPGEVTVHLLPPQPLCERNSISSPDPGGEKDEAFVSGHMTLLGLSLLIWKVGIMCGLKDSRKGFVTQDLCIKINGN